MTAMRIAMFVASGTERINYTDVCIGRVPLTQELLDSVAGDTDGQRIDNLLDEARVGCCQKCGCQSAVAALVQVDGVWCVVAQCAMDPGERELGHRIPDSRRMT